jgi:peroxiredoxin
LFIAISGGLMAPLRVGEMAPDFEVPAVIGTEKASVKLSDYRGKKNVLLAFYPADWTPT